MTSKALDPVQIEADTETMTRSEVIREASPGKSPAQRSYLRGLGHHLKPTAHVGHGGVTQALADALDDLLEQHELIKVKLLDSAPLRPESAALWIHRMLTADVVQIVGRVLLVYRPRKQKPTLRLPAR